MSKSRFFFHLKKKQKQKFVNGGRSASFLLLAVILTDMCYSYYPFLTCGWLQFRRETARGRPASSHLSHTGKKTTAAQRSCTPHFSDIQRSNLPPVFHHLSPSRAKRQQGELT